MALKGKAREKKTFEKVLYVGLAEVEVVAINPTRAELNALIGKEDSEADEKEEFKYLDYDDNGVARLRLAFWLREVGSDRHFVQSILLINDERKNKNGDKVQIINSTCGTSWVPFKEDSKGMITDEVEEGLIQDWFIQFTDKDKNFIGRKKWRKALYGEEDLGTLLRAWLNMKWTDPDTEVLLDMGKLFKENFKEIRGLIGDSDYTNPFTILTGVRTSEKDPSKKYQEIFKKAYLPSGLMPHIKNGNRMPSDYTRKAWKKFVDTAGEQYGFTCFYKLTPVDVYDEAEDPVSGNSGKPNPKHVETDNEY